MDEELQRCIGDLAMLREHWGRRPLLRRGDDGFDDLLSLDDVDRTITTTTPRRPTFRLVRDGTPLPPTAFTTSVRLAGRTVADAADPARILALVGEGATLVLQGLQRTWPPLVELCRGLERSVGHAVQANAYLTPPAARGLGLHADGHDVLLLQVAGDKHWEVRGAASDEVVLDTELTPGDVLYLPAGARHAARSMAGPSLHITLGFLADTWAGVVRRALASVGEDLDLDAPLPPGWHRPDDDGGFLGAAHQRLAAVAAAVTALDPTVVADTERHRSAHRRPPLFRGGLTSLLAVGDLVDATPVRRRPHAEATLTVADDVATLVLVDRTLRLPAIAAPALEAVLASDVVTGADLADHLDPESRLVLLRRLVREGLLS